MFFNQEKQLKEIASVLKALSRGDFEQQITNYSGGQIGQIVKDLNASIALIRERILKLEASNTETQTVLNSMAEAVIVVDKETKISSVNPTAERIFEINRKEALGMLFIEAIRNSDLAELVSSVLSKGDFISKELVLVWPISGSFLVNASPICQHKTISGCLLVIHDITKIRQLETMRRDFVANVSHELKTPLTSIKGYVETLLEGALDDKENNRNFLKIIHNHTERLNNLINDLLDLSYLESKEVDLERQEFDLVELYEVVSLGFSAHLKQKKVKINDELSKGHKVKADKNKIEQVFTNLIDNAIKFNREGGNIKVIFEDLGQEIKVIIEDSGLGIPDKDIPRIFERFYRVDKARSRELGGTGLGLSIVKHIIELHAGKVGVESIEGLGSKFWFILPK